jgi:hypothetical protein
MRNHASPQPPKRAETMGRRPNPSNNRTAMSPSEAGAYGVDDESHLQR